MLESLRVTLAHEYAHVLQYGYDILADGWHFESSAVWMEQRMYPEIKDWLRFVNDRAPGDGWRSLSHLPLTYFEPDPDAEGAPDRRTAKPYGDVVWHQFLSSKYGAAGDALQRAQLGELEGHRGRQHGRLRRRHPRSRRPRVLARTSPTSPLRRLNGVCRPHRSHRPRTSPTSHAAASSRLAATRRSSRWII